MFLSIRYCMSLKSEEQEMYMRLTPREKEMADMFEQMSKEEQEIMIELAKRMRTEEPEKLLKETILFDEKEIGIIVEAIKNHSTKNKRHDMYSELLKMCDVVDSYLHEPEIILDHDRKYYLEKWRKLDE